MKSSIYSPAWMMPAHLPLGDSDDFDEEIVVTCQNKALMAFLDERAAHSQLDRGALLEEVRRLLGN